ncbi:LamG-like jellyroll fold domain-containing protein [Blastococcus sp. PRF04-17]|uniref:LamG-like jellyroll fold domain-containing protein n=1 Tax=Blastococcus sp. PRF04-17 TaxID=2933797 RepID=UPI001FF3907E|nr:LamG-like jellyroll fold domain-containing protein [Blastococcus sp. PRF04-17]UOY04016.1 PKD domain-containing protein [Blastococcus sp. PRF04-17]
MTAHGTTSHRFRRAVAGLAAVLVLAGAGVAAPTAARADSAPQNPADPATPTTVTADPLPTVQINGVVWSQVVVGNTVYAAGKFTRARPAGAAPGTQETVRNNLLAYDIRTGELITSFAPSLNAQALVVTASPDGSRIYVGGDFTQADGQVRNRIAAYSTATGQLVAEWRPSVNGQVRAIAATNSSVYLGGSFTSVGSVSRHRLAAVAANGPLLPWAPRPGSGPLLNRDGKTTRSDVVMALVLTGGGSQVVAAGRFDTLNGTKATGVGALDARTGQTRPFNVNRILTNQGVNSAVYSLSTDGVNVYGTAYDFYGPGNLEGAFSATADGGILNWINECHGDTYSSFPFRGALYLASHAHVCSNIGGFPEQNPRVFKYATAMSLAATGKTGTATLTNSRLADGRWSGALMQFRPAPSLLPWFPTMGMGTYTGQLQAGWSVAAAGDYVVYGGEFPHVNGVRQQGLVRYAMPSVAPNKVGPSAANLTPTVTSPVGGMARLSWRATSDQDNEWLTYRVYRDGNTATPVHEMTRRNMWWTAPAMHFTDLRVPAGTHTYRVTAVDPMGNQASSPWTTVQVAAGSVARRPYADAVRADGASSYWPLGESSGSTAFDHAGLTDLPVNSGITRGQPGALSGDADTAYRFSGTNTGLLATQTAVPGPNVFSIETWFKTTSTTGGKIVGFGNSRTTANSTSLDRHLYMDAAGRLLFGVHTGTRQVISPPTAYNDGRWHHVVASLGPAGMALYVDGVLAASRAGVTSGQPYSGYWRIGGDATWAGAQYFNGVIDDVAIYPVALRADRVAAHHRLGVSGGSVNRAPEPRFTVEVDGAAAFFDAQASADPDGQIASYAWNFGDGTTGSGATTGHAYAAAGTYPVTLTVTDDDGATASVTEQVTVTAAPAGVLAADDFNRSVTGGLGSAGVGGPWAVAVGADRQSVTPGVAELGLPAAGNNTGSYLPGVSHTAVDVRTSFRLSSMPTGAGTYVHVTGRRVGSGEEYRVRVRVAADGSVGLALSRLSGGTEAWPGGEQMVPGLTYAPGTTLHVRVQVSGTGSTDIRATVWAAGSPEPAAPQLSRTDTTAALQTVGSVGLAASRPTSATAATAVRFTSFIVTAVHPD